MKSYTTIKDNVLVYGFFSLLVACLLISVILPDVRFSENENRNLSQIPEITLQSIKNGRFMDDFENYASDQFPLRNTWVGIRNVTDIAAGKKDNGDVYFGKDNWLIAIDKINEKQRRTNTYYLTKFLSGLREGYPETRAFLLPAPSASEIMKESLPLYAPIPNQRKLIEDLDSDINGLASICDVSGHLITARASGYNIYYKTDHHWTTMGAYYAYRLFANHAGFTPLELEDYNIYQVTDSFYGTNDSKANLFWTKPDPIVRFDTKEKHSIAMFTGTPSSNDNNMEGKDIYDDSFLKVKDKYSYFLGGNEPAVTIDTDMKNSKTILVIKDSYANCFVPFLTRHYERIILVDLRYYREDVDRILKENKITDLLILYNVAQLCNDRNLFYLN